MLTATNEQKAIDQVQEMFPSSYVHCFGEDCNGFDVAVYDNEAAFDADVEDGDNARIQARYTVNRDA